MLTPRCQGPVVKVHDVSAVLTFHAQGKPMSHPVVWFEVLGKDAQKLQGFYAEAFGWSIKKSPGPMEYGEVAAADRGIPGGIGAAGGPFPSGVRFYISTDDCEKTLARAEKLGGKRLVPPTTLPDGMQIALLSDPEGYVVGLVQRQS
jgi:predicted enzyme related to lactoylglutathione lyase